MQCTSCNAQTGEVVVDAICRVPRRRERRSGARCEAGKAFIAGDGSSWMMHCWHLTDAWLVEQRMHDLPRRTLAFESNADLLHRVHVEAHGVDMHSVLRLVVTETVDPTILAEQVLELEHLLDGAHGHVAEAVHPQVVPAGDQNDTALGHHKMGKPTLQGVHVAVAVDAIQSLRRFDDEAHVATVAPASVFQQLLVFDIGRAELVEHVTVAIRSIVVIVVGARGRPLTQQSRVRISDLLLQPAF
mmetsp:Transcript_24854/g.36468  ORF Transcript_24854/g.36468 Transcript_24854/m.36468 type:complete len:244 (-) Transcript_24854:294-1025(-)